MVGSSNSLLSFNLNLQLDKHVDFSPTAGAIEHCTGFGPGQLGNNPSLCNNYLKLIERVPTGNDSHPRVMVCGTNTFFPKCTLHDAQNISSYEYMTHPSVTDEGFSPYRKDIQIVATLTSTGRFFSASIFDIHESLKRVAMAPYPLQGDNGFTVFVPLSNQHWLQQPTFVSSYEIGDHVYFFLRELANEINSGDIIVYSRAMRICKNDDGAGTDPNVFRTFQKARMACRSSPAPGSVNPVQYSYDNLQSTFLWKSPDGQQFLYGVFSSPTNGPIGSAICKFSFDPSVAGSLTNVFEDGQYLVSDNNNVSDSSWSLMYASLFECPGNIGTQRTRTDAEQYQLVYNPVTALQPEPIYTMFGKLFTSIVVEMIDYGGSSQTIMYFATAEGDIHYLIIGNGAERHEGIIYETDTPLSELTLHNNSDEKRYLYVITGDRILLITLGDCSRYTGCFECLDSNDAYCGWDEDTSSCKNKLTFSSPILQAALTHEDNITRVCGPRLDIPTSQTEVSPFYQSTDETTAGLTASLSLPGKTFSVTEFLGTTIGIFIGAFVIGMSVSAFIFFINVRMSHQEVNNDVKVNDM